MNNEFNIDIRDVLVTFDGKEIGTMQTSDIRVDTAPKDDEVGYREYKNGETLNVFNREYSMTLENVEINEDFIGILMPRDRKFTLIGTGFYLPRGTKVPKKKRLHKKWVKKYQKSFTLNDCVIY